MASAKVIANDILAEFRAEWSGRETELENELQRAANLHAAEGRSRSGALLNDYARIYRDGLASAKAVFLARTEALASRQRRLREKDLESLAQVATAEIAQLGSTFDVRLSDAAAGMGLSALAPNVDASLQAIGATMRTDMRHAFQTGAARVGVPWLQRPVGYVFLTTLAGVIVWLISRAL